MAVVSDDVDAGQTVLYIEDNPANLKLMQQILTRRTNVHLLVASSAEDGIELARRWLPNIILLDINMPRMDGYTALNCLRELNETRHIPVIAVSANSTEKDLDRGKQAGFAEYVTKPLNVKRLLELLDQWL